MEKPPRISLEELIEKVIGFRDERDWKQFHKPKDVALSLLLEAGEVLEHFQWKPDSDFDKYIKDHKEEFGEELADVLYWLIIISHDLNIDLLQALDRKIVFNGKKYPIEKSKGRKEKYTEL